MARSGDWVRDTINLFLVRLDTIIERLDAIEELLKRKKEK